MKNGLHASVLGCDKTFENFKELKQKRFKFGVSERQQHTPTFSDEESQGFYLMNLLINGLRARAFQFFLLSTFFLKYCCLTLAW